MAGALLISGMITLAVGSGHGPIAVAAELVPHPQTRVEGSA
jgi:hypothetical protein